jgi:ATP-dependent Clp protease ATP-binding subunit ClpA
LKRVIQRNLETPLSTQLLAKQWQAGDVIVVEADEKGLTFKKKPNEEGAVMPRLETKVASEQ